jgi:hypothetical protein
MNEFFLHFIWQYQFFDKKELKTTNDEKLTILNSGHHNTDQGPDFSHARILMHDLEWHGNVEIHLKASDWYVHKHQADKNYDTIILHVVWENDREINREDNTTIPVLELKDKVDIDLIDKYKTFINSGIQLSCQYYLKEIPNIQVTSMFDKALIERLERKGREIFDLYTRNKNDWEETFWQVLARNFGFKINNDPFERLSCALPYKLLLKHSDNELQLEALLFGQSGMLDEISEDSYATSLKKEYTFLSHKYSLEEGKLPGHLWKFLRTRPYNFPTIRIAQLAAMLKNSDKLINLIYEKKEIKEYLNFLKTPVSLYWQEHYRFGEKIKGGVPGITETAVYNIIINVVIPFKTARYMAGLSEGFPNEPFALLEKLPAEINKISKEWERASIKMKTAFDSQAGIELYNQYCLKRKCLYCSIGTYIIKH